MFAVDVIHTYLRCYACLALSGRVGAGSCVSQNAMGQGHDSGVKVLVADRPTGVSCTVVSALCEHVSVCVYVRVT